MITSGFTGILLVRCGLGRGRYGINQVEELLHQAMTELNISARGYNKILKVGRTIADLDHSKDVHQEHISEAVQYRNLDRDLWR